MSKIVSQISKNMVFRYRFPCLETDQTWNSKKFKLDKPFQVPCFGEFDGQKPFADLRLGWNQDGLLLTCEVRNKKKSVWCRTTQILESDGLQIWLDTRNTGNVHRATKFCHWFVFLPAGGGSGKDQALASMLKINRAKADPPTFNREPIPIEAKTDKSGYQLRARIPAACLNGWNPTEQREIGFSYAIMDREFGWQTLAIGPELPIFEDPSLWQTMELREND